MSIRALTTFGVRLLGPSAYCRVLSKYPQPLVSGYHCHCPRWDIKMSLASLAFPTGGTVSPGKEPVGYR